MPQLVKGGKWAYGWVIAGPSRELTVPPDAWREYCFRAGEEALFVRGSRRSGGFAVCTTASMAQASERLGGATLAVLGRGRFEADGRVWVPPEVDVRPGDRLLAVRGSRYGLGFVARGPIYEEALRHPELECFGEDRVPVPPSP